jgi:hypothetical protein
MKIASTLTAAQKAALAHPFDGVGAPAAACMRRGSGSRSALLTCDVDAETADIFGGPVWHASVSPPIRAHAEALLDGVGVNGLFEEFGDLLMVLHLRKRMTAAEIERLGSVPQ